MKQVLYFCSVLVLSTLFFMNCEKVVETTDVKAETTDVTTETGEATDRGPCFVTLSAGGAAVTLCGNWGNAFPACNGCYATNGTANTQQSFSFPNGGAAQTYTVINNNNFAITVTISATGATSNYTVVMQPGTKGWFTVNGNCTYSFQDCD